MRKTVPKTTLFETVFSKFHMLFSGNKKKIKNLTCRLFWLVALLVIFSVFNLQAQTNKSDKVIFDTCETGKAGLANAANDFVENGKPGSFLVIIGGSMKGEKSSYNSRRIQQAIEYITWGDPKKSDRIITGIGMPETEAGYLRFYVNGILSTEIRTRKNAKLCWGEGDEIDFRKKD